MDKFILLRTLNYVRISHGYWWKYNVVVPSVLTALSLLVVMCLSVSWSAFGASSILKNFTQILSIMSPFYMAALAAISTFTANARFDEPLRMVQPPSIRIIEKGEWRVHYPTLRHFLSMLFGYCAVVSFVLFLFTIFIPIISIEEGLRENVLSIIILSAFLMLFYHSFTATLLGMYYLSDKMHRG